jgi:hypothetical protein
VRMRVRVCLLLAAGVLGANLAVPHPAAASLPGPSSLSTGFDDDTTFESLDPTLRATWLDRAQRLSSSWVRLAVPWFVVAPAQLSPGFNAASASDPNYHWAGLDAAVRDATARRQNILLMILQAPSWAWGPNPASPDLAPSWRPDVGALGAFSHALAQRYSGRFPDPLAPGRRLPRVSYFQAWNEPNLRTALTPQWALSRGRWVPASPSYYRRMLNAVYANVKAAQPHASVLAAGLAPYGDPPGVDRMSPVTFLREMLCLSGNRLRRERCPNPAHFDAIDIHPYAINPTLPARKAVDISVPDIGKLKPVLRAAVRSRRAFPRRAKPIWMTELDWTSNPPDPFGISVALQSRYLALGFYELWRQGVSHIFWFLIRDLPYKSLTGAGVFFRDGTPKPSSQAFRFPFVALGDRHRMVTIWGRAPVRGTVAIERLRGKRWRTTLRLRVTRGGIFYARRRIGSHLTLRARVGRSASLPFAS